MTKQSIFTLLLVFISSISLQLQAQQRTCGTDALLQTALLDDPSLSERMQVQETAYQRFLEDPAISVSRATACDVAIIPIVVHVIYDNAVSNISDAQIQSQIQVLNQDYRRLSGTPGFGAGADTYIQFCLASKDPGGNATTGITRTQSSLTNHQMSQELSLKGLIRWNTQKYLNIWVVKSINNGVLGYSSLPGFSGTRDGVVVAAIYFGTTGTTQPPFNGGRTTTHEIGHFLGLQHTFNDGCAGTSQTSCSSQGDLVCDTPAESVPKYGCPNGQLNSCKDTPKNYPDPIRNFMNYVDDACMDEFTEGQRDRMDFFFGSNRAQLISALNLQATGCDQTSAILDKPLADFRSSFQSACAGDAIQFFDETQGCVSSYSWLFPGGTPFMSSDSDPLVNYNGPGLFPVNLIVSNSAGSDTFFMINYIDVVGQNTPAPYAEGFELTTFPPVGWKMTDEEGFQTWERTNTASSGGASSVRFLNFSGFFRCESDILLSPPFDLSAQSAIALGFDYAYQAYSSDVVDADRFVVEVSTNCGKSFPFKVFDKSGPALSTKAGFLTTNGFIPGPGDWRTEIIDLSGIAVGKSNVRIRMRMEGNGGQDFFLDDIELGASVGLADELAETWGLFVGPNPVADELIVGFAFEKRQNVHVGLFDLNGRSVFGKWLSVNAGQQEIRLTKEVAGISAGLYLLRIQSEGGVVSRKVLVRGS